MRLKRFVAIIVFFLLAMVLHVAADPFSFLRNGEYAYYHDTRGSMDFYRGYCAFRVEDGSVAFFIRNLDLHTGKEFGIEVTLKADADGKPAIISMKPSSESVSPEVQQSYIDLLNFLSIRDAHPTEIGYDTTIKDLWDTYTLLYHFDRDLPVFGFDRIQREGDSTPHYVLDRIGRVQPTNTVAFFRIQPSWLTPLRDSPEVVITPKPTTPVPLGSHTIVLDDRWHPNKSIGVGGYWLEGQTERDSQISLEESDWKHFESLGYQNLDEFVRLILSVSPNVLPLTVRVESSGDVTSFQWEILDQNNVRNIEIDRLWVHDGILNILNFSSFYGIYEKNEPYYKAILASFK